MSSTPLTLLCHYRYDPLDRLINQNQADQPAYQHFYCKSRLTTEIQGAIQHSILQHGDLLLAQQQRRGDEVSATLLATDPKRSVLHTLEKTGQRQAIAHSPYGYRGAENGFTSLLGFNGERLDPVTGCYILGNGYRAFSPALMRFNKPDSLSPFGKGGLNPYAYCLGDPINRTDPNGHWPAFLKRNTRPTTTVVYQNFTRKIARNISPEVALNKLDRLEELDTLLHKDKSSLYSFRNNKIKKDRYQLVKKMESGNLSPKENKRYIIQHLIFDNSEKLQFSYRDLKTFGSRGPINNNIVEKFKTTLIDAYPNIPDKINTLPAKEIHDYLKNDITGYVDELKQIKSAIRQSYKEERRDILNTYFLPPFQ